MPTASPRTHRQMSELRVESVKIMRCLSPPARQTFKSKIEHCRSGMSGNEEEKKACCCQRGSGRPPRAAKSCGQASAGAEFCKFRVTCGCEDQKAPLILPAVQAQRLAFLEKSVRDLEAERRGISLSNPVSGQIFTSSTHSVQVSTSGAGNRSREQLKQLQKHLKALDVPKMDSP